MCLLLKKQRNLNLLNLFFQKQTCSYSQKISSEGSNDETDVPIKFKGRLASNEQKRIISDFITESSATKVDWNALKTSVLSINRGYINERNINGCILEGCSRQKRLDLAKTYVKYLKECGQTKLTMALELLYFRSCYVSRDQLTDDDRFDIQTRCQTLFKNNSHLLNSTFLEGIVMGLCCTSGWRDSIEHLKVMKNEKDVSISTLICIVVKAFEEEEFDLGWTFIQKIFNLHRTLPYVVVESWFNICEKNVNSKYLRVLEFLRDNECVIQENLADLIRKELNKFGCKISTSVVYYKNGQCKSCNQFLKPIEITSSEFKELQECFLSNIMIGDNIFKNTSPHELENFKDFIEMTGPVDVVVDGLNIAYAYRQKIDNNSLTKIVMKIFIEKQMKILLIGRKHLVNILGKEFDFIKKNAHIFFTNDLSKDDPFILYAAMYSGINTKILTRDLMRSHKFLLKNPEIKSLFQKWLQKNRLVLQLRTGNHVKINNPFTYSQLPQESAGGIWHLPYHEIKEADSWSKPDSTPDNWMCIKT